MGDRANVVIKTGPFMHDAFVVYSHWAGTELPQLVQDALNSEHAKSRDGHPAYQARILVSKIIPAEAHGEEGGWGLSHRIEDNEAGRPVLVVDLDDKEVWIANEDAINVSKNRWSFDDFREIKRPEGRPLTWEHLAVNG